MSRHSHRRGVALLAVLALAPGATGCTTALADEIVRPAMVAESTAPCPPAGGAS